MTVDPPAPRHPVLLYLLNDGPFFVSHRLPIALAAQQEGYDVHLAAPGGCPPEVAAAGIPFHAIRMSRSGANPLAELRSLIDVFALFRRLKPDLVHAVTIKPVLYGGLAARAARVPAFVAAVSGLGAVFLARGPLAAVRRVLVRRLYRSALRHRRLRVIFQNPEDRNGFVAAGIVAAADTCLFRGSGVDLTLYPETPEPEGPVTFTLASRLLRDKGVLEFVEAARLLKARSVPTRFQLVGAPDPGNPASLTAAELSEIASAGHLELLGHRSDMPAVLAQSHVVVLPSYREGLPRVLAEAAAAGRAVITADVPGCRDAVVPGETGLLVPARDAAALAAAMQRLVEDPALRRRLGDAGRHLAEREFNVELVVESHLQRYRDLVA